MASLHVEKLDSWRVTLTPQAFLGAKRIAVMVAGDGKAERSPGPFPVDRQAGAGQHPQVQAAPQGPAAQRDGALQPPRSRQPRERAQSSAAATSPPPIPCRRTRSATYQPSR